MKKKKKDENWSEDNMNMLNILLREAEVLGPTPPEQHHHISKDVHHKVDVLRWLADNRRDPALKVGGSFIKYSCKETYTGW